MRKTQLLFAIGVALWSAVAASGQTSNSGPLPGALRAHLQAERFDLITSIRGLPLGVRDALERLFGNGLDIAEPGAEFQVTNTASRNLPSRRMIAAGCSADFHCLVYYERGGTEHTVHVTLFHWSPNATRFEWGGTAPGGMKTIEDVRMAVLSGENKGLGKVW